MQNIEKGYGKETTEGEFQRDNKSRESREMRVRVKKKAVT